MPQEELDLRQLEPGDKVTGLKLGDAAFTPLKIFFQRHARSFHENDLGRTYVVEDTESNKIIAYVTLVSGQIEAESPLVDENIGYGHLHYPAAKIARLAVDSRARGVGLGRQLIEFSLGLVKQTICPAIGCRFVVVDSKQQSVDFYRRCGFTMLDTKENRARDEPVMFVDLRKIQI